MTLAQLIDNISYIIELIPMDYFIGVFIQAKYKIRFIIFFSLVIAIINGCLFFNSNIQIAGIWIALFLIPLIFTKIPRLKTFLYILISILIMNIFSLPGDLIAVWLYPDIQLNTDLPIYVNVAFKFITLPLAIFSWYVSNRLCARVLKIRTDDPLKRYFPFLIVEAVAVILLQLNMFAKSENMLMTLIANTSVFVAMIVIDLLLARTINQLNLTHKTELELQQAQSMIRSQSENYAMFQSQLLSLHRIRHDVANQLGAVSYLLESGKYEEARQQLNAFRQASSQLASGHYTGNTTIDAVINVKLTDLDNDNISFESEGSLPSELPIDPSALCSVMSNLLDNAINTCLKLTSNEAPAVISLTAGIRQNYLILRCSNPCPPDTQVPDNSQPNPQDNHGWGIHILKQIAEQYNGNADFSIDDDRFIAEIQLGITGNL